MTRIWKNNRFRNLGQNRIAKYALYAVGEIILVVIGILIALQVNNWNEKNKNSKKEVGYLRNLQQDLRIDSLRLAELKNDFEVAVDSKKVFETNLDGNYVNDSLVTHFMNQHYFVNDFIPNTTTLDELTNSNGLNLINNEMLRREIVTLYNTYEDLILKLQLGSEKSQRILAHTSNYVNDITSITHDEMYSLLADNYFKNQIRMNYLVTQLTATQKAYNNCVATLYSIGKELQYD